MQDVHTRNSHCASHPRSQWLQGPNLLATVLLAGLLGSVPAMAGQGAHGSEPLVIKAQGSYFLNEQNRVTAYPSGSKPIECGGETCPPGSVSVNGVYVEYQVPQAKKFPYPIVMIHGAGHTGQTWNETPDGREGWKTYFLRKGFAVYVIDHAGRGRSGFDPTPNNRAKATGDASGLTDYFKFTNEAAWSLFRIGAVPYVPFPGARFPVGAFDEYVAQMQANTETTIDATCQTAGVGCNVTVNGVAALLDKIGPAIVMGHSQGGTIAMRVAAVRPQLVKAVVPVEPASSCVIEPADVPNFRDIKMYALFGDNLTPIWEFWSSGCQTSANSIVGVGGKAEVVMLARDLGILGNSHMLMMENNNHQIADMIVNWLEKQFRGNRNR